MFRSDQIIWMFGNSTDIPDGFQLIDSNAPLPAAVRDKIISEYVETSQGSGVYTYFAVRWLGY